MIKFIKTDDNEYINISHMTGFKIESADDETFVIIAFIADAVSEESQWIIKTLLTMGKAIDLLDDLLMPMTINN
jgi:hypothetical protein